MKDDQKVFIIVAGKVAPGKIRQWISHRGVVTGYKISSKELQSWPMNTKFLKKDVFVDEEDANKALFLRTLKKDEEETNVPSEDVRGNRRWIPGFKKRKWS